MTSPQQRAERRAVAAPTVAVVVAVVALAGWTGHGFRRDCGRADRWHDDEPQIRQRQVAHVRTALPRLATLGYVYDLEGMEAGGLMPLKEYLITQYCLVPHLLVRGAKERLVLVDARHATPARLHELLPDERGWVTLRDLGNQLYLLWSWR